jgi:hypothetical protein
MTEAELTALRQWATYGAGFTPWHYPEKYQAVLRLLDDHARLTALVQSLSERCAGQSELLTQQAEKQRS